MSKDSTWAGSDHRDEDLRHVDLRGKVLFNADLRGANLYNIGLSLNCDTFDGVKLDDRQMAMLLRIIALADVSPDWINGLCRLVKETVGFDEYEVISRYLQLHVKN